MLKLDKIFIKFLIVGLSNTLISYLVFVLGLKLLSLQNTKATTAQLISYLSGILWSYYWNKGWTFESNNTNGLQKFFILQISLAILSTGLIGVSVDYLHFYPTITWLVIMGFITIINYWLSRNWVFIHD